MQRSELITTIRAIEPEFRADGRTDAFLMGYLDQIKSRRVDSAAAPAPQVVQRFDVVERFDGGWSASDPARDGADPDAARARSLQRKQDASKKTGFAFLTAPDAASATAPGVRREDECEDPVEAARLRAAKRAGR